MEPVYEPGLVVLKPLTAALEDLPDQHTSIIKRCQERADLYRDTWTRLEARVKGLAIQDKRLIWVPEAAVHSMEEPPDRPEKKGLDLALVQDIETNLAHCSANITPIIRSIVGPDNLDVAPISRWDFNIAAHPVIDRKTVGPVAGYFCQLCRTAKNGEPGPYQWPH